MPSPHVAFGDPLGHFIGAGWTSPVHVDVVPSRRCTIAVDGREIMRDSVFTMV